MAPYTVDQVADALIHLSRETRDGPSRDYEPQAPGKTRCFSAATSSLSSCSLRPSMVLAGLHSAIAQIDRRFLKHGLTRPGSAKQRVISALNRRIHVWNPITCTAEICQLAIFLRCFVSCLLAGYVEDNSRQLWQVERSLQNPRRAGLHHGLHFCGFSLSAFIEDPSGKTLAKGTHGTSPPPRSSAKRASGGTTAKRAPSSHGCADCHPRAAP